MPSKDIGCSAGCLIHGLIVPALLLPLVIVYFADIRGEQQPCDSHEDQFDPRLLAGQQFG